MEFSLFSTPPSGWRGQAVQVHFPAAGRLGGFAIALALFAMLGNPARAVGASTISVTDVRHWSLGDVTRIAVQTTGEFRYKSQKLSNPDRIYFDILGARQRVVKTIEHSITVDDGLVRNIRLAQNKRTVTRIVLDLGVGVTVTASQLSSPDRLMIEIRRKQSAPSLSKTSTLPQPGQTAKSKAPPKVPVVKQPSRQSAQAPPPPEPKKQQKAEQPKPKVQTAKAAPEMVEKPAATPPPPTPAAEKKTEPLVAAATPPPPTVAATTPAPEPDNDEPGLVAQPAQRNRAGGHSLTRVLGLKLGRVVIDPGHGGRDTGTIGPTGLREKEVTLDVSRRLAKLIENRMGSEVILTRDKDSSLKLRQRTDKANSAQADLFVSVHVNSSRYRTVNGVETFYLNFTRSRADLEVAARENAGSDMPMHELSTLVQKIALDDKIQESRDLAATVQTAVYGVHRKHYSKARDRGVKKAPFVVLIGAEMPSILVELGFISNPREEKLMKRDDYRQQLAESLYDGISKYAESLSRFQVAQVNDGDE
jgi:N-acetylmuramoyl-L-alanine amidase